MKQTHYLHCCQMYLQLSQKHISERTPRRAREDDEQRRLRAFSLVVRRLRRASEGDRYKKEIYIYIYTDGSEQQQQHSSSRRERKREEAPEESEKNKWCVSVCAGAGRFIIHTLLFPPPPPFLPHLFTSFFSGRFRSVCVRLDSLLILHHTSARFLFVPSGPMRFPPMHAGEDSPRGFFER